MTLTRISNAIYWLFLALWFGALVMTGITAAIAFPTLKTLGVTVPGFEAVPTDEHFKIAAGHILYQIFFITDCIQLTSVIIIIAITGLQLYSRKIALLKIPNLIRLAALTVVLLTLAYHLFQLAPRMNTNLRKYWDAAKAGEDYARYQQAFEAEHPTASKILGINALGLTIVILSSGFLLIPGKDEEANLIKDHPHNQTPNPTKPKLEEPALLNKSR